MSLLPRPSSVAAPVELPRCQHCDRVLLAWFCGACERDRLWVRENGDPPTCNPVVAMS